MKDITVVLENLSARDIKLDNAQTLFLEQFIEQDSIYKPPTFFSKNKYINKIYIKNGGWHFSNIKNASEIELKLRSYLHHREFD